MNDMSLPGSASLVRYDAACRALAEAKSVDEVKNIRDGADAVRAAARVAKNRQLEVDAAEIRIRAERRLGELMAMQRQTVGLNKGAAAGGQKAAPRGSYTAPRDTSPTLAEAGIDKHLADRARKMAAVPEPEFEEKVTEWRGRVEAENERVTTSLLESGAKHVRGTFGTGENEWYTPPEFIEAARDVLGAIDLDPASSAMAQLTVRAGNYFTEEDDGLAHDWLGRVWLNPPYAQPFIADFAAKMVEQRRAGNVTAAIMLTHNYTDTAWFQGAAAIADAICFTRGRVRFVGADGSVAAPTQGQAFFYFGGAVDRFAARFARVGFVVRPATREVADGE